MADSGYASTVTLAAGVQQRILAPRPESRRISYSITNTGAAVAYIVTSDDQVAVAGSGIELLSGSATFDSDADIYRCWSGAIGAISTVGTTLSIQERVRL